MSIDLGFKNYDLRSKLRYDLRSKLRTDLRLVWVKVRVLGFKF
jgi:hypothetical protein